MRPSSVLPISPNQYASRFQLALFWSTSSSEVAPFGSSSPKNIEIVQFQLSFPVCEAVREEDALQFAFLGTVHLLPEAICIGA
jgi:hypothetical protein